MDTQRMAAVRHPVVFAFEGLDRELAHPPIAVHRAFLIAGISLTPRGWAALPEEGRRALLALGSQDAVDRSAVMHAMDSNALREMQMRSVGVDPPSESPTPDLEAALVPYRRLTPAEWRALRPIDRFALWWLRRNARMLMRAVEEILPAQSRTGATTWSCALAHAEVRASRDATARLDAPDFLSGRALVLARASGVRAARAVSHLLDVHANEAVGTVELDARLAEPGFLVWQAHVTSWAGTFSPGASLLAASTAALSVVDMLLPFDPKAAMSSRVQEETWSVGSDEFDVATEFWHVR